MSTELNPLEQVLLPDLHRVIQSSPLLWEAYLGLPENHRDAVDRTYLDLIDQTIMAAVVGAQDVDPNKPLRNILEDDNGS